MYIMWYAQNSTKNNSDNDDSPEDKRARNKNRKMYFMGKNMYTKV